MTPNTLFEFNVPSDTAIAYTAGIIDGEGSIQSRKDKIRYTVTVVQSVSNHGEQLCDWLTQQWGFGSTGCYRNNHEKWEPLYRWSVNAIREVIWLLEYTSSHMIIKQEQAFSALAIMKESYPDLVCGRKWSDHEIWFLKFHRQDKTADEIALHLGRTLGSVLSKAAKMGIPWSDVRDWTATEDEIIRQHYPTESSQKFCHLFVERTPRAISNRAIELGLKKSLVGQRVSIGHQPKNPWFPPFIHPLPKKTYCWPFPAAHGPLYKPEHNI